MYVRERVLALAVWDEPIPILEVGGGGNEVAIVIEDYV
jgi:hypothetical protein